MFKEFFNNFDKDIDSLGIRSYGISVTTLEEVFLKVGSQGGADHLQESPVKYQEPVTRARNKESGHKQADNFDSLNINSNNM